MTKIGTVQLGKEYFSTKFLAENFFSPHCGKFFLLMKKKPHMHFDIPKNNFNPKIEKFHCYMHRFAVSKVDLPPGPPPAPFLN
jgi:hypothetical protein